MKKHLILWSNTIRDSYEQPTLNNVDFSAGVDTMRDIE
jgi:hypothetical protein